MGLSKIQKFITHALYNWSLNEKFVSFILLPVYLYTLLYTKSTQLA